MDWKLNKNRFAWLGVEMETSLPLDLFEKAISSIQSNPDFVEWWKKELTRQQDLYKQNAIPQS